MNSIGACSPLENAKVNLAVLSKVTESASRASVEELWRVEDRNEGIGCC